MPVLEVIVCSVSDALEAERGGADRLEIVRELGVGGLTPPISLVREIVRVVSIPVRVMVRENNGFSVGNIDALREAAGELAGLGVEGLVLGFLEAGRLDFRAMADVLAAGGLKATLHHAFDAAADPLASISIIKRELPQVDRILTRGGAGWDVCSRCAAPEITILAGGGLDASAIRELRATTTIREFHAGRAARDPSTAEGRVTADRVRALADAFKM